MRSRKNNQVVTVARDGDVQGAYFDRMVSNMRLNESAIPVLVKGAAGLDSGTSLGGYYDFGNIAASDEFVDLSKQFKLFKIKAIRFEVFHQVASFAQPIVMSTFHTQDPPSAPNIDAVIDGEDSKFLDAGAGKQVFYWTARGSPETDFQSTTSLVSLGGLRYFREQNAVNPGLRQVTIVWTAQVVFKGRY
jgi:hypothetical protein